MPDLPDSVVHWLLGVLVTGGGGLFMFLLKRTFKDFEDKIGGLFKTMEGSLKQAQEHDVRLAVIEQRLAQLEAKKRAR